MATLVFSLKETCSHICSLSAADRIVVQNAEVVLDASKSTDEYSKCVNYTWTFEDGTPQTLFGKVRTYRFRTTGTHTVNLTVTDADGNVGDTKVNIIVQAGPVPIQSQWWFWPIIAASLVTFMSVAFSLKYYQTSRAQSKMLAGFQNELETLPISETDRARTQIIEDVIRRKEKIERFETKHGVRIRSSNTLEEIAKKMGIEIDD
jgi:hypothetical protein